MSHNNVSKSNGPLAPRARARQRMLAKVEVMVEDRDTQTDLSHEPDLTDFPVHAWQFLGANLCAEDIEPEETDEDLDIVTDSGDDAGWNLSAEEAEELFFLNEKHRTSYWHPDDLLTLRRLDGLRWVEETYGNCQYGAPKAVATTAQSGSSGFGSGEKYKVADYFGWDWGPGRRGHDDARKQRKAAVNRFRRLERKLRTVEMAELHESKADFAFNHFLALDRAYRRSEFLRSPDDQVDWWCDITLTSFERFLKEEEEWEEEQEQRRQDARLEAAHFRDVGYGDPYDDYGMGVYPDDHFDPWWDDWSADFQQHLQEAAAEDEEMRIDMLQIDEMWREIDREREEDELDAIIDELPAPAFMGDGARGWRARRVANLRHTDA